MKNYSAAGTTETIHSNEVPNPGIIHDLPNQTIAKSIETSQKPARVFSHTGNSQINLQH